MYDGTKLRIHPDAQRRLRTHALLAGRWRSRGHGKAVNERHTAKWNGWTFTGDATRCWEIRGSFHKAHHGGTNWQDYTFVQFCGTVAALRDAFGLHDAGLTLAGLEVGVNIVPPIPTAEVLRSIVLHKNAHPVAMMKGHGIEIVHAGYRFKVYNKAAQYPQHVTGELLRVEVKVNKMRTLAGCEVRSVADLLDPAAWTRLRAFLLSKFNELLIVEPHMPTDALRPAQRDLVAKAAAPSYWQAMDKRRRSERRRTLRDLFTRYASPNLKATIQGLIAAKLAELNDGPTTPDLCTKGTTTDPPPRTRTFAPRGQGHPATPSEGQNRTFAPLAIRGAKVRGTPSEEGSELGPCSTPSSTTPENNPAEGHGVAEGTPSEVAGGRGLDGVRRCLACGRDISDQDPRSRVCSERIYGKAGKACRNKLSNRTLSLQRMAVRGGFLFDDAPYIRPSVN